MRRMPLLLSLLWMSALHAETILVSSEGVDLGSDAIDALLADVNGDGLPDIVSLSDNVDSLNILVNSGPDGDDRINFGNRRVFQAGADPRAVGAGDFDGDGHVDLAVTDYEDDKVYVFKGDGSGGFARNAALDTGAEPTAILSADVNDDGLADLLALESDTGRLAIFIATASGFSSRVSVRVTENPAALAVADVDGDGDSDVVVGGSDVSVLRNDGSGRYLLVQTLDIDGKATVVLLQDIDNDNRRDLLVASSEQKYIRVIFNDGSTTPYTDDAPEDSAYVDDLSLSFAPVQLTAADITGDGEVDILAAASDSSTLLVIEGTGYGKFVSAESYTPGGLTSLDHVGVGDVDRDGRLDVLVVSAGSAAAHVYRGLNRLHYDDFSTFSLGLTPVEVAAANFDYDGYDDAVVRDSSQALLYLLRSDGEGEFVLFSTLALGAAAASIAVADLDSDGLDDLLVNENGSTDIDVYLSLGSGTVVHETSIAVGERMGGFITGEFDGLDGLDVAVIVPGSNEVRVFNTTGALAWTLSASIPVSTRPTEVVAGDLEGDGVDELLIVAGTSATTFDIYQLAGGVSLLAALALDVDASAAVLADIDGDGDADIAAVSESQSVLYTFIRSDGAFAQYPLEYPVERGPVEILLDDVDADGDSDAIVISAHARRIGILFRDGEAYLTHGNYLEASSSPANGALADINGDRTFEVLVTLPAEGKLGVISKSENEAPTATDMSFEMDEDEDELEKFLDGTDVNGDTLHYSIVQQPAYGSVELLDASRGYFRYAVEPGFDEYDSFTYRVDDGTSASELATVSIYREEDEGGGGASVLLLLFVGALASFLRRRFRETNA